MVKEKGKMGFFTLLSLCMGTIIGAGVFGSLPRAVNLVGPVIVIVFIVAVIEVILRYFPSVSVSAAIPAPSGFYMQLSRLVSPYFGVLQLLQILFSIFSQSMLATVFASYLNMVVKVNPTAAAIGVLLVFGAIGYFGAQTGAKVQNGMVVLLVIALFIYIFNGAAYVKPEFFTVSKMVSFEGISFTSFGAALGLAAGCLMGGFVAVYYADEVKKPHMNIVLAFIVSTIVVGVIYLLMGIITCGVVSPEQRTSLGDVAKMFMASPVWYFFIICGALFAIATTINGSIIGSLKNLGVIANDKVLPDAFARKNKHGISIACLLFVVICDIIVVSTKLSVGTLMSVSSSLGILIAMAQFVSAIKMPKKYPNSREHAKFKIPMLALYAMIAFATCFCIYELYGMIVTSEMSVWIGVAITVAVGYIYFFIRKTYLKSRDVDLIAIMSTPYEPWEKREKEFEEK